MTNRTKEQLDRLDRMKAAVAELMEPSGMTQDKLARELLGISAGSRVSEYLSGRRVPSEPVVRVAEFEAGLRRTAGPALDDGCDVITVRNASGDFVAGDIIRIDGANGDQTAAEVVTWLRGGGRGGVACC